MAKSNRHPLLEAVTGNPLLIDQSKADFFAAALEHVIADAGAQKMLAAMSSGDFWADGDDDPWRPYVVQNGVLQIPIQGVLLNRFSYTFGRWATGYQYIEKALARGLDDANVKAIALVCDSPGGEVAGCFELADKIFAGRERKTIRAFAADHAYSAAYALASSAAEVVVTRSGGTGSIGVVMAHYDVSKAMEDAGVKVTFVFAGDHKVDGNSFAPLPDSVKARYQAKVDKSYDLFVSTVARNRAMEDVKVRETKALTFDAEDSITEGLADRVGAFDDELAVFASEVAAAEDEQMSITQEMLDAAVATARTEALVSGKAEGKVEGLKEGATAERTRIKAILDSDEGKKRPKAALSMAMALTDDATAVTTALAGMPEEKADAAPGTPFTTAMENTPNPSVGAGLPSGTEDQGADFASNFFGTFSSPKPKAPAAN